MIADPCGKIQRLVGQLFANNLYIAAIKQAETKYQIKALSLDKLQLNTILESYYRLCERFYTRQKFNSLQYWHQNQLKIFVWLLVGYSFLHKRCISQMNDEDWQFFSEIFKGRTPIVIQFQARLLLKNKQKNIKWSTQQIDILKNLIDKNNRKNVWNEIARNLFICSEKKYLRTPKQCREFWINHLDPTPKKESWTYEQDYKLIQCAYENRKKWSKVSKLFDRQRTQHMIKNRFNSLLHQEVKKDPTGTKGLKEQSIMLRLMQKLKSLIKQESENAKFARTITSLNQIEDEECLEKWEKKNENQLNQPVQSEKFSIRKQSFDQFKSLGFDGAMQEFENNYEKDREYNLEEIPLNKQDHNIQYSIFNFQNQNVQFLFDHADKNQ